MESIAQLIGALAPLLILAVVAQAAIEPFKPVVRTICGALDAWLPTDDGLYPTLMLGLTTAVGISLAYLAGIDLIGLLGVELATGTAGMIVAGIAIGQGASFIHSLVDALAGVKSLGMDGRLEEIEVVDLELERIAREVQRLGLEEAASE